ncbi:PREDICTED: sporulation-specific protein 15-like [Vollenhovia emeryi]|uniref:sporulation-specific protein 15-like n=1 Tax=Vollenhovia emeryi TaxID=411798 RepID=UPI0005F42D0B|nr:PREDICTED: sporulation-specific protein 15-like [Vollenhovia emeryi]
MSYAEHGPRIFLTGRPGNGVPLSYGDYVLPRRRSEGRLKLYNSCTDTRAWSPNVLENARYFRELNEHALVPGKLIPFSAVMENMIALTARAQRELRIARRELRGYRSLNLTPEQRGHLENFAEATVGTDQAEEMRIESVIRPLAQEGLFNASRIASSRHFDAYMSIYFRPDGFRYGRDGYRLLPTNTRVLRNDPHANPLSENNTYLVSRLTSCDMLTEVKAAREGNEQPRVCIEYVDASSQAAQEVREMGVQTEECQDNDVYYQQSNGDSPSSRYYETSESVSTSESELGVNSDSEVCGRSHKGVIIQKDSEIIVLKNELGMKEDELEELRELNRHLQSLLKEKNEDSNFLRRNVNTLQEKLKIVSDRRDSEMENLSAKLSSSECMTDQLRAELARKCQVCYVQSQEIQSLRAEVKEVELLSMENESLTRKVKEMEHLSREAESCGIALEQMKNVWRERDMLQKQYHEQSCTLADTEDEIKRLLTLIKQMSVTADTREISPTNNFYDQVEMNGVVAGLRNEIQAKDDKISQCETQLVCMEREVGNLTNMLKSSLNNFDETKIAYEGVCDYTKCEHDTCLDVPSALSALKAFIAELEECKLERRNRLREIDNLRAYVACYSQETVSEITNTDFDTGHGSIQPAAEDVSTHTSSNIDCQSSKELVSVQIQSDDVDSTTTRSEESEKVKPNEVISYKDIDRALATHIKRSIDKMYGISAGLQGAGDHHVQIVKEFTRQQQELQKKDLEITELKQKVAEHVLRRGEGDCAIQEQLRQKMLEKEKVLEAVISKRDSKIERLHEHLAALESDIFSYRAECDALKIANADLVGAKSSLSKETDARSEELRAQRDRVHELTQQIDDLKRTVQVLEEETSGAEDMKTKLIDLQTKNNDLANKLVQANEAASRNAEVVAELERKDERNRIALTHGSIKYDAMITQKHSDIVKLRDENQSLRDQLRETEVELARSNDTISLRRESDNAAVMNVLQATLSDLDVDKERLLARVDCLKSEMAGYRSSAASVESRLQALSRGNEALLADIETVRNTNDQLSSPAEETITSSLKDALYTLPQKIYDTILRLRTEIGECDKGMKGTTERCPSEDAPGIEDGEEKRQKKVYANKSCERDILDPVTREVDCNFEDVAHKLRFLEGQHEGKLQEIKNLMDDVKLRDREIKSLHECITYLLQEKNELQAKAKCQMEEYQNTLTLLKRKYDSSLNAFRKRHNENVERLQARFEDIMKIENSSFDAESWLQSLNLKELSELHNRVNILCSHAAENTEPNTARIGTAKNRYSCRNNSQEHRLHNKFTLRERDTRENRTSLRETGKVESHSKILNAESNEKPAVTELYSRDVKLKQERRYNGTASDESATSPEQDRDAFSALNIEALFSTLLETEQGKLDNQSPL